MKKRMKVCIVGAGSISKKFHIPAIIGNSNSIVNSIVDIDAKQAESVGNQFDIPFYTNFEEIPDADICFVATPPKVRESVILPALEKGMNIVCEKPLALNYKISKMLIDSAKEANKKIFVAQSRRFFPNIEVLRSILKSNLLKSPIEIIIMEGGPFNWTTSSNYLDTKDAMDNGIINDVGSHVLDLLALFLSDLDVDQASITIQESIVDREIAANNFKTKLSWDSEKISGKALIKLSRSINLMNKLIIRDSVVSFVTRPLFDTNVEMHLRGGEKLEIPMPKKLEKLKTLEHSFSRQWDSIMANLLNLENGQNYANIEGYSVLNTMKIVDEAINKKRVEKINNYFLEGVDKWL